MKKLLALVFCLTGITACALRPYPWPGSTVPVDGHTSRLALDWVGTYQALLPCADCEAILTTLTLADANGYELKRLYVGKDTALFVTRGRFRWHNDGTRITLDSGDAPTDYLVQENRLLQLDMGGERITGALAEHYLLDRVSNPDSLLTPVSFPLQGTRWQLRALHGQDLAVNLQDRPWLQLDRNGNVVGFAGCNSFSGTYTQDGLRLRFHELASTLRGCLDPAMNDTLLELLQEVDNYSRSSNMLSLNRARMAALAEFEATVAW
jgi:copper homeostasis protein (lipoprotein)